MVTGPSEEAEGDQPEGEDRRGTMMSPAQLETA